MKQVFAGLRFGHERTRADFDRRGQHLRCIMLSEDYNFGFRDFGANQARCVQAADALHTDVHDDDVRLQFLRLLHGFEASCGFPTDH